ncbi:4'-phosphopantetheinyl transferase family protein [Emergencia sp.]|uniref:4'-phosphopantetheinyl transferase family protein n=1 Tax=Emergencia sp. TaxID=1926557 RepID=UPI003AF076B2
MNSIYLYEGPFEKGDKGFPMIKEAAKRHAMENNLNFDFDQAQIVREEKGKPYFADIPLEFSLTHSGQLWMCLFSGKPVGLDLQQVKSLEYEKIADRQYTKEEQHYVRLWGLAGFFDVWVRKEAFCKCTGQGLFTEMPSMADENHDLCEEIIWQGKTYCFTEIPMADDLKCVVCSGEKMDIETRIL